MCNRVCPSISPFVSMCLVSFGFVCLLTCCTARYLEAKYVRMERVTCPLHHNRPDSILVYNRSIPAMQINEERI